ncbi:MAG: hypothetical protein ABSA05_09490 [Opitutaceae bacterium]
MERFIPAEIGAAAARMRRRTKNPRVIQEAKKTAETANEAMMTTWSNPIQTEVSRTGAADASIGAGNFSENARGLIAKGHRAGEAGSVDASQRIERFSRRTRSVANQIAGKANFARAIHPSNLRVPADRRRSRSKNPRMTSPTTVDCQM